MKREESERAKSLRQRLERFSKEALCYFLVHDAAFPSSFEEDIQQIEWRLLSERLLKRMHEVAEELKTVGIYKSRKERDLYFRLQDEFDVIRKRLDRIQKKQDALWKKRDKERAVSAGVTK